MARPRFVSRSGGPKRQYIWSNILTHIGASGMTGKNAAGLTALGMALTSTITLVRTRGYARVHFDPTATSDVMQFCMGLGVFSSDAFTVGVTALPGPLTDADYDWIYFNTLLFGPALGATELEDSRWQTAEFEIDSKAMRKIKPNQTIGWVFESVILNGGGTMDANVSARHLFKLP